MNGLIFKEFQSFIEQMNSPDTWNSVLTHAGFADKNFIEGENYDDRDMAAIMTAYARSSGTPMFRVMEIFGQFLAPKFLGMGIMMGLVQKEWTSIDVLLRVDNLIHKGLNKLNPNFQPPDRMTVSLIGQNEVRIIYRSSRRMCALLKGLTKGMGTYFDESLILTEHTCLLEGENQCDITVSAGGGFQYWNDGRETLDDILFQLQASKICDTSVRGIFYFKGVQTPVDIVLLKIVNSRAIVRVEEAFVPTLMLQKRIFLEGSLFPQRITVRIEVDTINTQQFILSDFSHAVALWSKGDLRVETLKPISVTLHNQAGVNILCKLLDISCLGANLHISLKDLLSWRMDGLISITFELQMDDMPSDRQTPFSIYCEINGIQTVNEACVLRTTFKLLPTRTRELIEKYLQQRRDQAWKTMW